MCLCSEYHSTSADKLLFEGFGYSNAVSAALWDDIQGLASGAPGDGATLCGCSRCAPRDAVHTRPVIESHHASVPDESDQTKKSLVPFSTTEKRIRFREVDLKPKKEEPPPGQTDVSQYEHTSVNAKKRKVQTVEQLVGNEPVEGASATKGRRGRRKSKGKEKAQEDVTETTAPAEPVTQLEQNGQTTEPESGLGAEQMDTTEG